MVKAQNPAFPLMLIVIRKVTSKGAELVRQRLVNPSSFSISAATLATGGPPENTIFDTICRNAKGVAGIPASYVPPTHKFEHVDIRDQELVTMIHPILLNGPVADVFLQARDLATSPASCEEEELPRGTELLEALGQFDDPLLSVYDSLTAKVRFCGVPTVIPFGQSELGMMITK